MAYIGLDIGTSGCKAAVVGHDGHVLASASRGYALEMPAPGWMELAPEMVWQAICETLREIAPCCGQAKALSVSGIGESFVLLDAVDRPLYPFITYLDQRCEGMGDTIRSRVDEASLYDITGLTLHPMYSLSKIRWFQFHRPDVWKRAKRLMLFAEYFTFRLTGQRMVDYSTASRSMIFDVRACRWSERLLALFGIPQRLLSPVAAPGEIVGTLCPEVGAVLDLPAQLTVYLGCHDQVAACLGTGAFAPGDAMVGEGSSESINMVADASVRNNAAATRQQQVCTEPFLSNSSLMVPVGFLSFGTSLRWYVETIERELFQREGENAYAQLDALCAGETSLVFLPYLSQTHIMDANARALGAFLGITAATTRAEMYRAVLEGLHFESRMNFEIFDALGLPLGTLVATGGLTHSHLSMQLKADILGREIRTLNTPQAGILGLVIICAVACGDFPGYPEAIAHFVRYQDTFYPCGNYAEKYQLYRRFSRGIKELYQT